MGELSPLDVEGQRIQPRVPVPLTSVVQNASIVQFPSENRESIDGLRQRASMLARGRLEPGRGPRPGKSELADAGEGVLPRARSCARTSLQATSASRECRCASIGRCEVLFRERRSPLPTGLQGMQAMTCAANIDEANLYANKSSGPFPHVFIGPRLLIRCVSQPRRYHRCVQCERASWILARARQPVRATR